MISVTLGIPGGRRTWTQEERVFVEVPRVGEKVVIEDGPAYQVDEVHHLITDGEPHILVRLTRSFR